MQKMLHKKDSFMILGLEMFVIKHGRMPSLGNALRIVETVRNCMRGCLTSYGTAD
jgi:hypothetical protein